ncbi:DegT/DnrJ/EryC1/StrS family aminotransferase [Caulobacter sp. LARHSG274]
MTRTSAIRTPLAETAARRTVQVARPRLPTAEAILPYLQRIDAARWYSNFGPLLMELEARLAHRFGDGAQVVTTVNATQALTLALKAMDLPAGSLCATPSWTFVATAHAVRQAGLIPWFVDVDAETWMLDPAAVRERLAHAPGPVSAVIPVAAFGHMPDLDAWRAFQDDTAVRVLVDAAAAFDAASDASLPIVVSLHATKVMGLGEGGFLATRDPDLARQVRRLTSFGFDGTREALCVATNAKLSEYAAAVGLAALDGWPADRLRWFMAAQALRGAVAAVPQVRFQSGWGARWTTSVCVVGLPDGTADTVETVLRAEGVDTRRWWGEGCHLGAVFADCPRDRLPNTERLARSTIGLPFAIDLTAAQVGRVAEALALALPGQT